MDFFLHEVVITSFLYLLNFHLKNRQCSLHRCWLLFVRVKLEDRDTTILQCLNQLGIEGWRSYFLEQHHGELLRGRENYIYDYQGLEIVKL